MLGLQKPGGYWRLVALILALLNLKNLPLAWHVCYNDSNKGRRGVSKSAGTGMANGYQSFELLVRSCGMYRYFDRGVLRRHHRVRCSRQS